MYNRDYEDRCYKDDPRWQDIQFEHRVDVMTTPEKGQDSEKKQAESSAQPQPKEVKN